jgi:hypothetical protein
MTRNILKGFKKTWIWLFDLNEMEGKMGPCTTFLTMDVFYPDSNNTFDDDNDQQTINVNVFEFQKPIKEGIFETQQEQCHYFMEEMEDDD